MSNEDWEQEEPSRKHTRGKRMSNEQEQPHQPRIVSRRFPEVCMIEMDPRAGR